MPKLYWKKGKSVEFRLWSHLNFCKLHPNLLRYVANTKVLLLSGLRTAQTSTLQQSSAGLGMPKLIRLPWKSQRKVGQLIWNRHWKGPRSGEGRGCNSCHFCKISASISPRHHASSGVSSPYFACRPSPAINSSNTPSGSWNLNPLSFKAGERPVWEAGIGPLGNV